MFTYADLLGQGDPVYSIHYQGGHEDHAPALIGGGGHPPRRHGNARHGHYGKALAKRRAAAKQARKARKATRLNFQRFGRKRRMEDLRLKVPKSTPWASIFYINHRQKIRGATNKFMVYAPGPELHFAAVRPNHDFTDFIPF